MNYISSSKELLEEKLGLWAYEEFTISEDDIVQDLLDKKISFTEYKNQINKLKSIVVSQECIKKRKLRKHVAKNILSSKFHRKVKINEYEQRLLTIENNPDIVVDFCHLIIEHIENYVVKRKEFPILEGKTHAIYDYMDSISGAILHRKGLILDNGFELNEKSYNFLHDLAEKDISIDQKYRALMISEYFT